MNDVVEPILKISNLCKIYSGEFNALKNVSLEIGRSWPCSGPTVPARRPLFQLSVALSDLPPKDTVAGFDIVNDFEDPFPD